MCDDEPDIMAVMPSTVCAYCERVSHMTTQWGQVHDYGSQIRFAATCDNCDELSVANGEVSLSLTYDSVDRGHVASALETNEDGFDWFPKVGSAPAIDDVPEPIARAAREAFSSASVNNHMAAILMARTVVEATAKAKGIEKGTLAAKIDAMRDQGFIRPSIAEQAHEVRFMGNDMAHGDIADAPTAVDSEELLALMSEVLSEVFQGPARLERIRNKRLSQ